MDHWMFSIASVAVESEPYWLRKLRLKHEPATSHHSLPCGFYRELASSTERIVKEQKAW
jgi:hypothetical protein